MNAMRYTINVNVYFKYLYDTRRDRGKDILISWVDLANARSPQGDKYTNLIYANTSHLNSEYNEMNQNIYMSLVNESSGIIYKIYFINI